MTSPHQPYGDQQPPPWSPPPATGSYQYPPPYPQQPYTQPYAYQQQQYVPQQRGYGPPVPPPRSRPKWSWVVGEIAVLLIIIVGGTAGGPPGT
jgi:hypothetical protein